MKFEATVMVTIVGEAQNERVFRQILKENKLFLEVDGCGKDCGSYSLRTQKRQPIYCLGLIPPRQRRKRNEV